MNHLDNTTVILAKIDSYWRDHKYPGVVRQLYKQAIELYWEILDKPFPPIVSVILYRTLFEQLLSILFILEDQDEMKQRAILFEESAHLRLKLRLKQLYEAENITKESPTLAKFLDDYSYHGITQQLTYDIEQHKQHFDDVGKHYMSEQSMKKDGRRRRWYRLEPAIYSKTTMRVENLKDVAHYLLGEVGDVMYTTIYSLASHINHGHWLESMESLEHIIQEIDFSAMMNALLEAVLHAMKGEKFRVNIQMSLSEVVTQSCCHSSEQLKEEIRHHDIATMLLQQERLLLDTAKYFVAHQHIRLAPPCLAAGCGYIETMALLPK